jgi:Cu/Ag efflux pump CusA
MEIAVKQLQRRYYEIILFMALLRLRKLMTVSVALFGLVPILWSTGTGADVMIQYSAAYWEQSLPFMYYY